MKMVFDLFAAINRSEANNDSSHVETETVEDIATSCNVEVQLLPGERTVMSDNSEIMGDSQAEISKELDGGDSNDLDENTKTKRNYTGSADESTSNTAGARRSLGDTKDDDSKTNESSSSSERNATDISTNDTTGEGIEKGEVNKTGSTNEGRGLEHQQPEEILKQQESDKVQYWVHIFSKHRLSSYFVIALAMVAMIVGVVASKNGDGSESPSRFREIPSSQPSQGPTSDPFPGPYGYLGFILADYRPLQQDAIKWLTSSDKWVPPENATNVEQMWIERYALATFYYSTDTTKNPWRYHDQWLSSESTCSWFGVQCNEVGEVVEINMPHNEMVGSIPSQIGTLTSLTKLQLDSNEFSASIPSEIGALSQLSHIDLYFNRLSGSLPNEVCALTSLSGLYLRGNQLSGNLPERIGELTSLTELQLSENQFSGSLPSQISALTGLVTVILNKNEFSGSLPSQVGALTKLRWLEIDENNIVGSLPKEIGALTNLITLVAGENKLSGSIPPEMGSLTGLFRLDLRGNSLEGSLPEEIAGDNDLHTLDLSNNRLSGSVPFLPTSLNKKAFKNGPRCSLASNDLFDTGNAEARGCDVAGQRII